MALQAPVGVTRSGAIPYRCWQRWEVTKAAEETPPWAVEVKILRGGSPIESTAFRYDTKLIPTDESAVAVMQKLGPRAEDGGDCCLVVIGNTGSHARWSSDSGLDASLKWGTDFNTVFEDDAQLDPGQRDALFAKYVKVSCDRNRDAIRPFWVPVLYVLAPPKPSWATSESQRFQNEMETKVLDIARISHRLGYRHLVLASTFQGLPARDVAAPLRKHLSPQAIGALMGAH